MIQSELDRQIARVTGESVAIIKQRGFSTLRPMPSESDRRPLTVNWDDAQRNRNTVGTC